MQDEIPITQEQWERLYRILHDHLDMNVGVTDQFGNMSVILDETSEVKGINRKIPEITINLCYEKERYDIIAEAMQLFHEMGVDIQEGELL